MVVGDSSFAVLGLLDALVRGSRRISMITRLRLDAALYDPAPPKEPGQMGRPRLKGARLPNLSQVLMSEQTHWHSITLERWYGESQRLVEVATGTAVWYHTGKPVVPIRWVLVRDPKGEFESQALLSMLKDTKFGSSQLLVILEKFDKIYSPLSQLARINRLLSKSRPARPNI